MKKYFVTCFALIIFQSTALGQGQTPISKINLLGQRNVITTAVPFLLISPDSRAAGMGDMGAATTPDGNSIHWNASKLAFAEKRSGISLSTAPWLRVLVPDIWLHYLSFYTKLGDRDRSAFSASMRYFTLGSIQFTDEDGNPLGNYEPKEFSFDASYATQLSDHFSMAVALRYIISDLARAQVGSGVEINPGQAGAGDISAYYKNTTEIGENDFDYSIGGGISNIGNKISYTSQAVGDFIPTNLRIGTFWNTQLDEYNEIGFGLDLNKLLVPTPQFVFDSVGNIIGKELSDFGSIKGMTSSFNDAPGGAREELNEINFSFGMEYWYAKQFALRAGYFHEAQTKGARKYITFGAGLKYEVFRIDAAYLQAFSRRHPLQNTIRFSLMFDIEAFKGQTNQQAPVTQ